MTAKIIDGKKIADKILTEIKAKVRAMSIKPGLAVVLVGKDPASLVYVGKKEQTCKDAGFYYEKHELDEGIDEISLLGLIDKLNQNPKIHGIIVQLPLPKQINEKLIIDAILPHKDADGFNPINMGNMLIGNNIIVPATPKGVIMLIESTGVRIEGKHAAVVGRSNIVGKPVSVLLQQKDATVTICHSKSVPLKEYTKKADILVVAIGRPKLIKADMVKKGAIVIDVGVNKVKGKLVGDVDFDSVKNVASYITPVPGGVGPITIAMLLENTLECKEIASKISGISKM